MSDSTVAEVAAQRLQAAIDARVRAEIAEAVAIAEYATAHEWHGDDPIDVVGTRPVRVGADGTPLLGEFVALELAVLKRISPTTATWLIRDILNLRDRHPQLWQQVQHGDLPVYRACQLVQEVARWGLDADQARQLDSLLAPKVGRLGWPRLLRLCRGLMCQIAPQRAIDTARGARADRYVRKAPAEDPAVSYLTARVDTADAIFFDAMIDRIADLLSRQGDQDTKEIRRAKSLGILATPTRAHLLLTQAASGHVDDQLGDEQPMDEEWVKTADPQWHASGPSGRETRGGAPAGVETPNPIDSGSPGGILPDKDRSPGIGFAVDDLRQGTSGPDISPTDPRLLPEARLYVHVAAESLHHGEGTARIEDIGPLALASLTDLLGHCRIRLTPVIQPYAHAAVDAYEIPDTMRQQVILRDTHEVFPYSSRTARHSDLDHTTPWTPTGPPDQTRPGNLGPLWRRPHRAKTHGHWHLTQPRPGIFWWTTPGDLHYRVGPDGTHPVTPTPTTSHTELYFTDLDLRAD